jgi:hypothetical protein
LHRNFCCCNYSYVVHTEYILISVTSLFSSFKDLFWNVLTYFVRHIHFWRDTSL